MIQEYKVKIGAYTDELKKVINEAKGEIQKLNDNEILIRFDYDGNLKEYNKLITNLMKAAPELTIQFQYDVNKKLLEAERNKLQELESIQVDIDTGQAKKKINDLVQDIKKSYDNADDFSVIESKTDYLLKYVTTLKKAGADISESFQTDLLEILDDVEEEYGKSLDPLLDDYDRGAKSLFEINESIEKTIDNTRSNVESISKLMDKLKSAGAIDLGTGTGEGAGEGKGSGTGTGNGEGSGSEGTGGEKGFDSEERIDDIKKLIDRVETLSADIAEMKQQLSSLSGSAFEEMALSVKKLEEELANTLSQIKELKEAGVSFGGATSNASRNSASGNQTSSGTTSSQNQIDRQEEYYNSVWEGLYNKQKKDRDEQDKYYESVLEKQNAAQRKLQSEQDKYYESVLEKQIETQRKAEAAEDKYRESILEKQIETQRKAEAAEDKYRESVLEKQNAAQRKLEADQDKFRESVLYGQARKRLADEKREEKRQENAYESVEKLLRNTTNYSDDKKYVNNIVERANILSKTLDELREKDIINEDKLKKAKVLFEELSKDALKLENQLVDPTKKIKLLNEIDQYTKKYSGLSKDTRAALSQLADSVEDIESKSQLKELYNDFVKIQMAARDAGEETQSMFATIGSRINELNAKFIAQFLGWQDLIQYIQQAVSVIRELDDALVDLKKTTAMSSSELEQFYYNANDIAKTMGVTTAEIIDQASSWSRLGYNSKEAAETMSRLSSQFASISPGMGVEEAQTGLVSIMKAWDVDVSRVERDIMDSINVLGNKFAETNADIIAGMERSGATLSAIGMSLEDSFALFTGAQEIIQNAEVVGTALKSLSLRIRGYDEETEELSNDVVAATGKVADLTKVASNSFAGVSLWEDAAQTKYKSLVDYLGEISEIWDEIDAKSQTQLLENLFGKRGASVGSAILQNFDQIKKAIDEIEKAGGSADAEMKIITESISFKLNALQETWVGIIQRLINRGDLGKVIDLLTQISEILGKIIDTLGVPGVAAGIGLIAYQNAFTMLANSIKAIDGLLIEFTTVSAVISPAAVSTSTLASAMSHGLYDASDGMIHFTKQTNLATGALNAFKKASPLIVLTGIIAVVTASIKLFDKYQTSVKEYDELIDETNGKIDTLKAQIKELEELDSPTDSQKRRIEELKKELDLEEKIYDLRIKSQSVQTYGYDTLAQWFDSDNANNVFRKEQLERLKNLFLYGNNENGRGKTNIAFSNEEVALQKAINKAKEYNDIINNTDTALKYNEQLGVVEKVFTATDEGLKKIAEAESNRDKLIEDTTDDLLTAYEKINDYQQRVNDAQAIIDSEYYDENSEMYKHISNQIRAYTEYIKEYERLIAEYENLLGLRENAINGENAIDTVVGNINEAYNSVMGKVNEQKESLRRNFFSEFADTDIGERIKHLNDLFNEGEITYRQYMEGLQTEFNNFDASGFTNTLEDAKKAEIQFFTDSAQVVAQGLSDLYSNWNSGNIDVNEYLDSYLSMGSMLSDLTDRLQENSAAWNENGEAISDSENKALDETQELLSSSMAVIESFQDSIYSLTQINSGAIKAGTDEYSAHLQIIAEDVKAIIDAGGEDADILASRLGTTTAEIAQSMYDNVANLGIAEQGIMDNTNNAITNMATAIGNLFDTLGDEISNFKVDLKFSPKFDGSKKFTILGKEFTVPEIKFELAASGKSLSNIGNAIKSFGSSIKENIGSQLLSLEDFHIDTSNKPENASKRYGSYVPRVAENSYDKALENVKAASKEAAGSAKDAEDSFEELYDYFERMIKVLDNSIDLLEAHLEDVVGSFAKNSLLDAEEDLIQSKMNGYSSAIEMYSQKASEALSKIPSDIAEKIQSGAVDIDEFIGESNKDVVEAIQEYEKWADKVQDCKLQIVQLKEAIRKLELDKFNNVMQDFTDQFDLRQSAGIDLISKQIDLLKEAGELIGESFYKRQQEQAEKQLDILTRAQEALVKQLNEALSRGVDVGSEEWLEMVDALTETEGKIIDCKKAVEEFDNALLELHTEIFNRIQDQFSAFASELSNMQELINDDANPVATVKNQWTDEGLAQLGLLAQQYELAKYQVAQYNEEIERLNQLYLQGRYSTTEYADKLIELKNAQWSAVEASESALDSIRSLNQERVNIVVEGINEEIESYEKYTQAIKDNLSAEKDLHDYQKQIADENKSILDIQRQLAAIQDDDSQAARARRAKLEEQLKEAQDALAETEYSHSIESQQDALDKQLEQYKETRQAEIDALQESLLNVEQILSDTFEAVRSNSQLIGETILAQAQAHGIEMSQALTDAWFQGENAIAHYGEILSSSTSNFIGQIQGVEYQVYELQNQANATAEGLAYMFSTRADNLVDELTRSYTSEYNLEQMTNALHNALSNTIDGSYSGASAAAALNSIADAANGVADAANSAASALRSMINAQSEASAAGQLGLGAAGNLIGKRSNVFYSGSSKDAALAQASWRGYDSSHVRKQGNQWIAFNAKGSKSISHDELSWVNENGPEMIISPSDGAILTPLKKGDAVLPTDQTSNIWEWSRFNPEEFASKLIQSIGNVEGGKVQTNTMQVGSLVTVNGNVNDSLEMMQIAATTATTKIKQSFKELSNGLNG